MSDDPVPDAPEPKLSVPDPTKQPVLIRRRDAAQATLDAFRDKPFKWGTRDCARLAAFHLRKMGYKVHLPPSGSYRSPKSAIKALQARGVQSTAEAIDKLGLERIAPAAALVGDIVAGESDDGLGSIGICLSNGRIVGFHPHAPGAAVLQPLGSAIKTAWRCNPR